jgi:hypothetical protein
MARRSSSSSSSGPWRYLNPAYYLKRPKRLALLFFVFVAATFAFWDRQSLVTEYEVRPLLSPREILPDPGWNFGDLIRFGCCRVAASCSLVAGWSLDLVSGYSENLWSKPQLTVIVLTVIDLCCIGLSRIHL